MTRRRVRTLATVAVALVASEASLIAGEEVAHASCAMPVAIGVAIRQADVVVVGTVVSTRSRARVAKVRVEDVWKGTVDREIEVFGGPGSEGTATSVDRTYKTNTRYLVFAYEPAAHGYESTWGRYQDSSCSRTQPYARTLAAKRPPGARRIDRSATEVSTPSGSKGGSAAWWVLVGVAVAAASVAVVVVVRRRRTSAPAG